MLRRHVCGASFPRPNVLMRAGTMSAAASYGGAISLQIVTAVMLIQTLVVLIEVVAEHRHARIAPGTGDVRVR